MRLFGLADHLIGLWRRVFDRHVVEMDRGRRQVTIGYMIEISVTQVAILISGIALVVLASTGQISIGQLVALLYGLSRFQNATNTLGWSSAGLIEDWTRIAHLRDFLALDSEQRSPSRGAKRSPSPFRQAIQFDGLGFTYPGSQRPALSGVNLTIRPNEHLALVGENGAGKTTLVRLLLGLYRPTEGRITVDGVDVADLDPNEWRQRATAIFQDFVRYPTTPFENIAFADPSLLAEDSSSHVAVHPRVSSAAAQAGADGFIGVLPFKYTTPLGKEWEGGAGTVDRTVAEVGNCPSVFARCPDHRARRTHRRVGSARRGGGLQPFQPSVGRQDRHPRVPSLGLGKNGRQDRRAPRRCVSRGRRSRLTAQRRWRIRPHVPSTGELVRR